VTPGATLYIAGKSYGPKQVVEVPADAADQYVKDGLAERIRR
jgi:hypothetical protein